MKYIEYNEALHGKLIYPDGFADLLKGLSLEEQMDYFRTGNGVYLRQAISQRRKNKYYYSQYIQDDDCVEAVIVCNHMIAGIMAKNCHGKTIPCLPERGFIIRDDSELDGSGYKEFQLFRYFICVTKDFNNEE